MATRQGQGSQDLDASVWLDALAEAQRSNDNGFGTRELADLWSCSEKLVRIRLTKLHRLGKLVVGWKDVPRLDGRMARIPCYAIKGPAKPHKGARR